MNITDFEGDFYAKVTFDGDNESDYNCLAISRDLYDGYNQQITASESYTFSIGALEDVAEGLERMAKVIRAYLNDKETF